MRDDRSPPRIRCRHSSAGTAAIGTTGTTAAIAELVRGAVSRAVPADAVRYTASPTLPSRVGLDVCPIPAVGPARLQVFPAAGATMASGVNAEAAPAVARHGSRPRRGAHAQLWEPDLLL
jgi:hypothetical protein